MKISIAMTTYNGEKYLVKQLDSLRMQLRHPDEVIIVDDNSQDGTCKLIEEYIKKYRLVNWKLIKNKENVGYRKNFSYAIAKTTGEIILLCDQDDVWHLDKLQCIEQLFGENKDILLLSTSFDVIDERGERMHQTEQKGKSNNNLLNTFVEANHFLHVTPELLIKNGNFAQGCCMAFRSELKNIFLKISENRGPHDFELNIIATYMGKSFFYNKKMIDYRIHANNTIGLMDESVYTAERKFSKQFRLSFDKKENLEMMKYLTEKNFCISNQEIQKKVRNIEKYISVFEKRNDYIKKNQMILLCLLNFRKEYRGMFSFKSRIADLLCCTNVLKIFYK